MWLRRLLLLVYENQCIFHYFKDLYKIEFMGFAARRSRDLKPGRRALNSKCYKCHKLADCATGLRDIPIKSYIRLLNRFFGKHKVTCSMRRILFFMSTLDLQKLFEISTITHVKLTVPWPKKKCIHRYLQH